MAKESHEKKEKRQDGHKTKGSGSAHPAHLRKDGPHQTANEHKAETAHNPAHSRENRPGERQSLLPIHEQIKRQLGKREPAKEEQTKHSQAKQEPKMHEEKEKGKHSEQKRDEQKKREPPKQEKKHEPARQEQNRQATKNDGKKAEKETLPAGKRSEEKETGPRLNHFEISMLQKIEIEPRAGELHIGLSGGFGLSKSVSLKKAELAGFLSHVLPRKINSMGPGDWVEVSGMDSEELEALFTRNMQVEPKGEIEVTEKEEKGKVAISIRVSEQRDDLPFNYSGPGLEDVRRLVEREKLAMMSAKQSQSGQGGAGQEEPKESDWLKEQITQQNKDVAAIAKELGEKVQASMPVPTQANEQAPSPMPEAKTDAPAPPQEKEVGAPKEAQSASGPGQSPQSQQPASLQAPPPAQSQAPQQPPAPSPQPAEGGGDSMDMAEFMDAYKEEAVTYVEALKKLPQIKDNPQNAELISEIHRSAHSLKSMSAAMGFLNISKISKALEIMFAAYKKIGSADMAKYDAAKEAVDRIDALYSDLANSEKANVEDIVKKVESATPS